MSLAVGPEPVPLETDEDGVMRVGGTRVTLDTVVTAFCEGATAEEISHQYSVISYYLRHQTDVDAYLGDRLRQGADVRRETEARLDPTGLRDRLLARRSR
jgi:hypothetical protein